MVERGWLLPTGYPLLLVLPHARHTRHGSPSLLPPLDPLSFFVVQIGFNKWESIETLPMQRCAELAGAAGGADWWQVRASLCSVAGTCCREWRSWLGQPAAGGGSRA